jgi:hypothetical protein
MHKTFPCICGKTFHTKTELEAHIQAWGIPDSKYEIALHSAVDETIAPGATLYRCTCGSTFFTNTELQLHQKRTCAVYHPDLGSAPNRCENCHRVFDEGEDLRHHQAECQGSPVALHRCEDCHQAFAFASNLLIHQEEGCPEMWRLGSAFIELTFDKLRAVVGSRGIDTATYNLRFGVATSINAICSIFLPAAKVEVEQVRFLGGKPWSRTAGPS